MTPIEAYLNSSVPTILRDPAGSLKHPFLVPGGSYTDQLWDWDSFWITKGLLGGRAWMDEALYAKVLQHAQGSWMDFFEAQAANGAIPIMVQGGERDAFGCTEDTGVEHNHAKPVFGQFALDIAKATGDFGWIAPYFDGLLRFYGRWTSRYRSRCGLLVWGSDVAVGVDNDPATYGRPEFSSANLLLNCLYIQDLQAAIEIAEALGRPADAERLRGDLEAIKTALLRECWDPIDGFFYSVDVQCEDRRDYYLPGFKQGMAMSWQTLPLKVKTFTGFLPLWCGIATPEQARILVERHLNNGAEFDCSWGVRTLARNERMYAPEINSGNPSNWLGPIWIVANYVVYEGLKRYGFTLEAAILAGKTKGLLTGDLEKTGTLHECYHPDTAVPNFNAGFLSWNVLAPLME